jgi:hypothetical protein
MDQELLQDFIKEILEINATLKVVTEQQMKLKVMDKTLFEKYGQAIDRIYGTATTLGFPEFGQYARIMKEVCYLCSQCDYEMAQKKVLRMMIECNEVLDKVPAAIINPKEFKNFSRVFLVEIAKAERMQKAEFRLITRKSIAS